MTTKELKNYTLKGDLKGFPKEIIARMLECQEEQGNPRDVSVFEINKYAALEQGGFNWDKAKEIFWNKVLLCKNFDLFFEKYPKKEEIKVCSKCQKEVKSIQSSVEINITEDDSQEFRVGDKVYDILCKSVGIITNVNTNEPNYQLTVNLENGNNYTYTIDGRINHYYKTPQLLHYRDDYDYTTIDFKNLPKRQELKKRWRLLLFY